MMRTWLVVIALGIGIGAADAQPRRGGGGRDVSDRRPVDRREQIKKKIRALRAYTLTDELALDERTASRLFPALARYDDETDRLLQKRVDVQLRLERADALRDPRAVERLIDEAVANQRGFWDLEEKRLAELRKFLTPVQTAKLLVVLPAFERRIQNQLRKAIVRRGAAGFDDTDDDPESDELDPPRREAPLAPRPRGTTSNAPGNTAPCDPSAQPCR